MVSRPYSLGIFALLICTLIILTIVLPSGSIFSINYKVGIMALVVPLFIYISVVYGLRESFIIWLIGFFIFLGVSFFIAVAHEVPLYSIMSHSVAFSSLFSVIYFSLFLYSHERSYKSTFMNIILLSIILFSIAKISISFFIAMGYWSPVVVQGVLKIIFNYEFIGLNAHYFYRVHLPIDYLLPLAFVYLYYLSPSSTWFRYRKFLQLLIFIAIIISYSRILYFIFFIILAFIVFDYLTKLKKSKIMWLLFLVPFVIFSVFITFEFIVERYFGEMASVSDGPRLEMYNALVSVIEQYPLLGQGLGSGATSLVRFEEMPWYYELQWLSFFAQFGAVGFVIILLIAFLPFFYLSLTKVTPYFLIVSVLYIAWLSVGIFNGFMLTSSAGVIFLFFILMFLDAKNSNLKGANNRGQVLKRHNNI